jgi:uncharacterized protein (DUF2267 family)
MATTGIHGLDTTIEKTNIWLKDIMEEMGWDDREKAYIALRAVLQTLRDRLSIEEAVELGAQLPMLVRGFYFEGWNPAGKPVRYRTKEEFLWPIREAFRGDPNVDVEQVTRAVYRVLSRRISEGEISDIIGILPKPLRELWESC